MKIPEFSENLPKPNKELLEKLEQFDDRISQWEDALRKISPYHAVYNLMKPKFDDREEYLVDEHSSLDCLYMIGCDNISNDYQELTHDNVVLVFAMFAAIEQWVTKQVIPKALEHPDEFHPVVFGAFKVDDIATVEVTTYVGHPTPLGTLLWPEDEVAFEGNWRDAYQHLVSLIETGTNRIPAFQGD